MARDGTGIGRRSGVSPSRSIHCHRVSSHQVQPLGSRARGVIGGRGLTPKLEQEDNDFWKRRTACAMSTSISHACMPWPGFLGWMLDSGPPGNSRASWMVGSKKVAAVVVVVVLGSLFPLWPSDVDLHPLPLRVDESTALPCFAGLLHFPLVGFSFSSCGVHQQKAFELVGHLCRRPPALLWYSPGGLQIMAWGYSDVAWWVALLLSSKICPELLLLLFCAFSIRQRRLVFGCAFCPTRDRLARHNSIYTYTPNQIYESRKKNPDTCDTAFGSVSKFHAHQGIWNGLHFGFCSSSNGGGPSCFFN